MADPCLRGSYPFYVHEFAAMRIISCPPPKSNWGLPGPLVLAWSEAERLGRPALRGIWGFSTQRFMRSGTVPLSRPLQHTEAYHANPNPESIVDDVGRRSVLNCLQRGIHPPSPITSSWRHGRLQGAPPLRCCPFPGFQGLQALQCAKDLVATVKV